MDALLGTMSDQEVGYSLGMSYGAVQQRRDLLGISALGHNRGIKWTPKMDSLLGTMSDRDVAEELEVSHEAVRERRLTLGITPSGPTRVKWTSQMDSLLGTRSDPEIAADLGMAPSRVGYRRRELGILPWKSPVLRIGRQQQIQELVDTLTYEQWKFACEWFDNCCTYCGAEEFLTEDHLVPVSKRGPRTALNIIPCCHSCNSSKHAKQAHLWIYEKFGMTEGKRIVERIVAYLSEVSDGS